MAQVAAHIYLTVKLGDPLRILPIDSRVPVASRSHPDGDGIAVVLLGRGYSPSLNGASSAASQD